MQLIRALVVHFENPIANLADRVVKGSTKRAKTASFWQSCHPCRTVAFLAFLELINWLACCKGVYLPSVSACCAVSRPQALLAVVLVFLN